MNGAFSLGLALLLVGLAPAASADIVPYVIVYGPHPDAQGTGNYCSDVVVDHDQVGVCAGTYWECPIYYDTYRFGMKDCVQLALETGSQPPNA